MPLWLDMLRTPMAAPETRALRAMRFTWLSLCVALGGSILLLGPLQALAGRAAPCGIALLIAATLFLTLVYLRCKQRADGAYLDSLGEKD